MNKSWLYFSFLLPHFLVGQDTLVSNYPGTTQRWEKIFNEGKKQQETIYYEDQSIWMQANYSGAAESWNWYYENGNPFFSAKIIDDQIQGTYRIWYQNEQLAEEIEMKDNLEDGTARFYYPSGVLAMKGSYAEGKMVKDWTFFDRQGNAATGKWEWLFAADSSQTRMSGSVVNGKMIGRWEYRSLDRLGTDKERKYTAIHNASNLPQSVNAAQYARTMGEVSGRRSEGKYRYFEDGFSKPFDGVLYATYENGNFKSWQEFEAGLGEGHWINFYENGNMKEWGTYDQNRVEGSIKKYHENGVLKAAGTYREWRVRIGKWSYYDSTGQLIKEEDYGTKGDFRDVEEYFRTGQISKAWYESILEANKKFQSPN